MASRKLVGTLAAIGSGAAMALAGGPAVGAPAFFSPITAFQDDNLDYVVDNNGNGVIDVGDRLVSVFEMANTQGVLAGQGPAVIGPEELTGVADVTVVAVDPVSGALVFGPSGAAGVLSGFAPGTAIALWTDATPDLNVINAACGTRATCLTQAGLAAGDPLFLTAGFFDPAANLWTSTPQAGGSNINTVQNGGSSTTFAAFSFELTIGINSTGQALAPGLSGSGNILGGQFLNPAEWTARSDTDAQVTLLAVPEPGSLALLGGALAAFGLAPCGARVKK